MILPFHDKYPESEPAAYIAPSADIIGDVTLGEDSSLWFHTTIRGDMASVSIGEGTNIQDNAVVHVNTGLPTVIGANVTVGHGAIIHGCTIGDNCLIGMGAIVLDGAVIPEGTMVAAGALVPPGKTYPAGCLLVGSPAKAVRPLTDGDKAQMAANAEYYVQLARRFAVEVR